MDYSGHRVTEPVRLIQLVRHTPGTLRFDHPPPNLAQMLPAAVPKLP